MKKLLYILVSLIFTINSNAQIIDFTDANFKDALLEITITSEKAKDLNGNWCVVDTNSDGEIEVSEAENLSYLYLRFNNISSMDEINNCINLEFLDCSGNNLSNLDLTGLLSLQSFICFSNELVSLNLTGLNSLTSLDCYDNQLITLDLFGLSSLQTLNCSINEFTTINLETLTSLQTLDCSYNPLISLDVSGLTSLETLECHHTDLTSLSLSGATSLQYVYCTFNDQLTSLDVSGATSLIYLDSSGNQLTTLNVSGLNYLQYIDCEQNQLTSLDVSNLSSLQELYCYNNQISLLNISGALSLEILKCGSNQLASLDVSGLTSLESLNCSYNQLNSLDVSGLTSLEGLSCNNNQLTSLDVSGLTSLQSLSCYNNQLTSLDVSGLTSLQSLSCYNNQLTSLELSGLNSLEFLNCSHNQLTILNLSGLASLNQFYCNDNLLQYLNMVGTSIIYFYDSGQGNNYYHEICCNIEQYETVFEMTQSNGYENCIINVGEDCSPFNQSFISISLNEDSDGCDENDATLESFGVNVTNTSQNTDFSFYENSNYTVYSFEENATITPLINSEYYTISPENFEVNYTQGNFEILEFCLIANGDFSDLEIFIIPIEEARPGFETDYKLMCKNKGTTTLSGNIKLTFEDDYMDFISANPTVDIQTENLLEWIYIDLAPFEVREIFITMELNTPTDEEFPLNSDDILNYQAIVTPVSNDELPEDNTALLNQLVVNSFDPNDKMLLEGENILPEMVGEYVHYRIRFENTGTANAINVIIEDTIDPASFEISTLQVVDSSHDLRTVIEANLVKFQFYNIDLPIDDANNDGYVVFKIKTLDTLELNDTFSNQAEIYFDYNAAIITNEYTTTVSETLGLEDIPNANLYISISPNPAQDFFQINTQENIQKVELFDAFGRLLRTFVGKTNTYDISTLEQGMYVVKVITNRGIESLKFMKE